MKDLCVDILDCCVQIQTFTLEVEGELRRKDMAVRLQAVARGLMARRKVQSLRREKRLVVVSRSISWPSSEEHAAVRLQAVG